MRSLFLVLTLSLIPLLFTVSDLGASEGDVVYAVESLGHADGTISYRHLVYDRQTDRFTAVAPEDIQTTHETQANFQRLLVRQSSKWTRSTTQAFRWAEKIVAAFPSGQVLKQNRGRIRQVMKLIHQRKGHVSMPRFSLTNKKLAIRDIADPVREYQ